MEHQRLARLEGLETKKEEGSSAFDLLAQQQPTAEKRQRSLQITDTREAEGHCQHEQQRFDTNLS